MSSSQGYLGAFESKDEVKVIIDKGMIEDCLSAMEEEDKVISEKQWQQIWKAVYESDLVSDFIEGVIEIADTLTEGKR